MAHEQAIHSLLKLTENSDPSVEIDRLQRLVAAAGEHGASFYGSNSAEFTEAAKNSDPNIEISNLRFGFLDAVKVLSLDEFARVQFSETACFMREDFYTSFTKFAA